MAADACSNRGVPLHWVHGAFGGSGGRVLLVLVSRLIANGSPGDTAEPLWARGVQPSALARPKAPIDSEPGNAAARAVREHCPKRDQRRIETGASEAVSQ